MPAGGAPAGAQHMAMPFMQAVPVMGQVPMLMPLSMPGGLQPMQQLQPMVPLPVPTMQAVQPAPVVGAVPRSGQQLPRQS